MALSDFARTPLLFGPSPVHRLERLSAHLGDGVHLWAKRDDCNSGLAFGGNKTRKLEYLVADAVAQGCDTLVSIGGVQSNHTRQVAAVAARCGLKAVLVQESSVTGSTQAGMIAGFAAQARERRVIGIDGSAKPAETHAQVSRIARFTAERIGLGRDLRDDEIVLDDRWHAGTYGIPDERTIAAMRLSASLEGMLTDPVYEGKSMAAMIDLVAGGEIASGSHVLYAHLGGAPVLSAYASLFKG
jgi:1-aminocyclopropane-1-carboxylate deaminase/D-cysteine desulfhydrase-like pyridoxal-dependent ACC family enzyme